MCRSIKVLRQPKQAATPEEIAAASLQFVRKVSGFHKPSKINQPAFDAAVAEVAEATARLLESVGERRPAKGTAAPIDDAAGAALPSA